ncbi:MULTISPECIES: pheST operon leader peptide PheM [Pantoea]|nr:MULTISPECIES: pheST operon leader peptide PheM [Pantoea]
MHATIFRFFFYFST